VPGFRIEGLILDIDRHIEVIKEVAQKLAVYKDTPEASFILKGGTALMLCYGLDRISIDIDLDKDANSARTLLDVLHAWCDEKGYQLRVAKNTETVQRAFISYGDLGSPLKVEASYRKVDIPHEEVTNKEGITVYTIDALCQMKASAFLARDKIRDLYDLTYILSKYEDQLNDASKSIIRNALEYKGIEQFDYLMASQDDELIDKSILETRVLESYEKVGLLLPE